MCDIGRLQNMRNFHAFQISDMRAAIALTRVAPLLAIATPPPILTQRAPLSSLTLCAPPPPDLEPERPPPEPERSLQEELEAGKAFGKQIRDRFLQPRIDDPGLPYADSLVCLCGALFVASISIVGIIPRPSWLFPLPGVPPLRSLPYILPAVSHGAGLAGCWLLGALAANAFEKEAYMGTLGDTLSRTWRGGAFSVGVLLLCTQFDYSASLLTQGVDPFEASREADYRTLTTAFEVITDVSVQAVGLTAFRIYRWADAQQYKK